MTLASLQANSATHGLMVMGALHPRPVYDPSDTVGTLILVGAGVGFWGQFTQSPEYADGLADPVDRWSKRVIPTLVAQPATFSFPSDKPYAPFIDWALKSGRFYQSPTGMMVHSVAGLMISIRGAIHLPGELALDPVAPNPCLGCADRPCTTACPVAALNDHSFYDVPGCKEYLRSDAGQDCMNMGCAARRACPVSQSFGRDPAQSAFHMRAFL